MSKNPNTRQQPKRQPGGAPPPIILNKIDVRSFNRREQEIPSWRNAHRAAESIIPRRTLLYDLYADVDIDGHVEAVTGKRRDAVTTANWQYVDNADNPIDEINQLIDSIGFEEMLKEIVNSKFWGYSMMEPTFFKTLHGNWQMEENLLPRLNYRPELGILARDFATNDGINVREGIYAKTIMEVGNPSDLGLYLKAAPYQILKRGGLGDWALFVQVFGNPIVDAMWDGFDEKQRLQLLDAINSLGAGGALVRPKGTEIALLQSTQAANGDLQDKLMTFLNKEISKSLLGSTETTESSSSSGYAQSKTHSEQDEQKNESDLNFTRRILNSRFITILASHGFNTKGGHFVIEGEQNELSPKETFDMYIQMRKEGIHIDDEFFYEKYGLPKPKTKPKILETAQPKPRAKNPAVEKKETELSLADKFLNLLSFFVPAPEATATGAQPMTETSSPLKAGPMGTIVTTCCGDPRTINLSLSPEPPFKTFLKAVVKAEGKALVYSELITHNIEVLTKGFADGWQSRELVTLMDVGIDYHTLEPKMQTAWEMNIFRFSTTKAAYQSAEVNDLFRRSKNFTDFERAVRKVYGVRYKPWLITEYNTAYQTAEAAATYYRILAQAKTFPFVMYKTIGDERVREAHRLMHDTVFPIYITVEGKQVINPVLKKISPPNGWACRCYWVPRLAGEVTPEMLSDSMARLGEFEKSDEWIKSKKSGFGINRADAQEVFTKDQFYTTDPDKVLGKLAKLPFAAYSLKTASEEQQSRAQRSILPDSQSGAARSAFMDAYGIRLPSSTSLPKLAEITDYADRPVTITSGQVSQGAYAYLRYLPEAINKPDEVWVNDASGTFGSFVYVKYFKNIILEIVAKLDPTGNLTIDTWKEGTTNRRGVLIRK